MALFSRIPATAVVVSMMASSAMGFALGAMPLQTVGGIGAAYSPAPTQAPSIELVKKNLAKKALTNVCTEWTIEGGFGQPQCGNSETCLFKTATDGGFYEGCGETGIAYDWVTACFNYPQSGSPPLSEIYCPKSAPYCGYYAFSFAPGYVFYNFGCSTVSYGLVVSYIDTVTGGVSSTASLNGGDTSSVVASTRTQGASTITVTPTTFGLGGASSSSTSNPTIGSHKAKTPIGPIVGGVVGGVVVIAAVAFLIWFCMRKRNKDKAKVAAQAAQIQQQQADAASSGAFQNNQGVPEIGGTNVKPFIGAYVPNQPEKQNVVVSSQPVSAYAENLYANNQGPPPVYGNHQVSPIPSPNPGYNELATPQNQQRPLSVPPVSPAGTMTSQTPQPQVYQQYQQHQTHPMDTIGENRISSPPPPQQTPQPQVYQPYQQHQQQPTKLVGANRMPSPPPQQQYNQFSQVNQHPPTELLSENRQSTVSPMLPHQPYAPPPQPQPTELGGENRGTWQVPEGVQEIGAGAGATRAPRPPQGPPPGFVPQQQQQQPYQQPQEPVAEMSATAASRTPRPPQGPPPGHAVDMSGAPMSENWNGHHELE